LDATVAFCDAIAAVDDARRAVLAVSFAEESWASAAAAVCAFAIAASSNSWTLSLDSSAVENSPIAVEAIRAPTTHFPTLVAASSDRFLAFPRYQTSPPG
jgi:hypothetical protein